MAKNEKARDVSAPIKTLTIGGKTYPLVFSNMAARIAEDVYELAYGKDVGYQYILNALARNKYSATMALLFGALRAGGATMEWEEFDQVFKLTQLDGIKELLQQGVTQSLPVPEPEGEEGQKEENPTKTPTES